MRSNERTLLRELLVKLNEYNAHDMLDGYLNGLGAEFNGRLHEMHLLQIEQVGEDEDETIDDLDFTIHHLTTDELYSAGAHNELDHEQALQALGDRATFARELHEERDFSQFRFYEGLPTNGYTILDLEPLRPHLREKIGQHLKY